MSESFSQDIFDKSPFVNAETTRYDPLLKRYFPIREGLVGCVLCQWVQKPNGKGTCEKCSAPNLKKANPKVPVYPVEKGKIAQYLRKVVTCWNTEIEQGTGTILKHPLVEKERLVVNISYQETHTETFCATCGRVYGWKNGRTATAQEIQDCRDGKIRAKMTRPVVEEVESA